MREDEDLSGDPNVDYFKRGLVVAGFILILGCAGIYSIGFLITGG